MFQYSQGQHTTQGHKGIPSGCYEEEQGRSGFYGPVSHLIKPAPSTRWVNIEGPLRPHLFDLMRMPQKWGHWQRLLFNADVGLHNYWIHKTPMAPSPPTPTSPLTHAFRNADGDTLYFCHRGAGEILTEYGLLSFRKGSYILVPKCVTHSFDCSSEDCQFFVIESRTGAFRQPDRGMAGRNAFYDPAAFGRPDLEALHAWRASKSIKVLNILVKRDDRLTHFTYADCVYDTLGWKGDFFPVTLHVDDLMPLLSARVHLPPSAHTTFVSQGFVVCTFLPRPLETDADALKVPFYHQNIDYDEVLFYHHGSFFSRDNVHAGMMSFHPAGFPHGPHPQAVQNIASKTHTDEYAVMVDSRQGLQVDSEASKVEVPEYWESWRGPGTHGSGT
ncbi:MAG: homogentisate 1,2-dioxygenase [Bdellovibrio sp.]|nr:MAG: homogentisate 1,2-dioxygenase [Bdellovibrio sp.]